MKLFMRRKEKNAQTFWVVWLNISSDQEILFHRNVDFSCSGILNNFRTGSERALNAGCLAENGALKGWNDMHCIRWRVHFWGAMLAYIPKWAHLKVMSKRQCCTSRSWWCFWTTREFEGLKEIQLNFTFRRCLTTRRCHQKRLRWCDCLKLIHTCLYMCPKN